MCWTTENICRVPACVSVSAFMFLLNQNFTLSAKNKREGKKKDDATCKEFQCYRFWPVLKHYLCSSYKRYSSYLSSYIRCVHNQHFCLCTRQVAITRYIIILDYRDRNKWPTSA